jgi:guanylate kinase
MAKGEHVMYKLKDKEMIFVFTGPDGSGRKTVADMVGSTLGLDKVLSYTTRQPRPGEVEGQDYHFISREDFLAAEKNGEFIEEVEIDGNLYGIKNSDIEDMFMGNKFIYLILNAKGAKMLKDIYGDKVTRVFIYVDKNIVVERQKAAFAPAALIDQHLTHYDEDMAYMEACKHSVENIDLAHTVFSVTNILELYMNRDLVDKD